MRCSDCTRSVRPVVAIDIDGTLGDYHGHFVSFASQYLRREIYSSYDGTGEFSDSLGMDKALYRQIKLAYRQGGMKRCMPVYPGAKELVNGVRAAGAEVWMTTTRPWMRLDNVDPDTRFWLDHLGVGYDALLYDEHKYEVLPTIVDPSRIVAVVDDLPEQIRAAKRMQLPTIHRFTDWNRRAQIKPGLYELHDIRVEILDRIDTWLNEHEEKAG